MTEQTSSRPTVAVTRPTVAVTRPGGALAFLYGCAAGRLVLKLLTRRFVSRLAGGFMNSRLSVRMIDSFVRKNNIDLSEYETADYRCYNQFFTRRIRPECRPIDTDPTHLISPCDCKLSAYPIDEGRRFWIKQSAYTVEELLGGDPLAAQFAGGVCVICRLTVDDYHRYCYIDDGEKEDNHFLPGVLHTVQPIALERVNIYKRNCREYTLMHTAHFGDVVQVEVGALMVGKICNHHGRAQVHRGADKGMFQFGGSTIVLLLRPGAVDINDELLRNTQNGLETVVRMGERIGEQAL